ncbi:unnamed protein product [Paramecium pentaurelia]|uniref:Uncharacterized protein n=1 Tax=Paramecium pentaurelia TaxID=43138 RepID=A0A8S1TA02_9CILI|nr:unnamed protein product [Paramecium pentaurelia]
MINTLNPLDEALIDKIRNLEQQIAQKDREQYIILNNLQRKNRELKNQFQQTQRQNMDTKKEVLQLQSKNDHFKIQVENYSNEIQDLKQKQQQLLNEQEFLSQEIKYLKSELKQDQLIESEILKKNEQLKRLHNTINELEKQLRLLQLNQQQNSQQLYQTQQINNTIQPCQIHQQNEEITIPVYVPIIEQTKYIEQPIKQYQVERIVETTNSNMIKPQSVCFQPVHYTTQQHWVSMQPVHNHHNHHHHHSCQSNYGYKYSYF